MKRHQPTPLAYLVMKVCVGGKGVVSTQLNTRLSSKLHVGHLYWLVRVVLCHLGPSQSVLIGYSGLPLILSLGPIQSLRIAVDSWDQSKDLFVVSGALLCAVGLPLIGPPLGTSQSVLIERDMPSYLWPHCIRVVDLEGLLCTAVVVHLWTLEVLFQGWQVPMVTVDPSWGRGGEGRGGGGGGGVLGSIPLSPPPEGSEVST